MTFVGTYLGVELLGLMWAYFVLKYSLRRASFFADICGGFYDMILTWITWGSMARASSIGGHCSSAYEEEESGSLWYARGVVGLGGYIMAMLFLLDVVGLKTVYYAFASALDLIETKQEEEEANAKFVDNNVTVVVATAASAGLNEEAAVPPRARPVAGAGQQQSGDPQQVSGVHNFIEVQMGCIEVQEGIVSDAIRRFYELVNFVVDKRQQRGTHTSRFFNLMTSVLVPLAGMATSAMYPAADGVINARALDEAPCVVGFDAISRLPPLIVLIGAALAGIIPLFVLSMPGASICLAFGLTRRILLGLTVLLLTGAPILAGVVTIAQAASGAAGVLPNISFRFTHFSFAAAISLHPFSAPTLLIVRTFRFIVLMLLATLRHVSCFQTGKVFYDDSGVHPRCDGVIGVLQQVNNTACAVVLVVTEILSIAIVCVIASL